MNKSKVSLVDNTGQRVEVPISLEDYQAAHNSGLSLAQHFNRTIATDGRNGTVFAQMLASCGLFSTENREFGIAPPNLKDILDGKINMGAVVERPDGTERFDPAGRLLFPAAMLEMLESSLRDNRESYNATFMKMVAQTRTVNSQRYDQVIIDYSRPRAARGMPISQLAEPVRMLSITLARTQRSIPVLSMGMEVSQEALAATTLDLVGLAMREHGLEERSAQLQDDFAGIVTGSVDANEPGLMGAAFDATSLDSTIANTAGKLTQKAWVKFLYKDHRKRNLDWIVCDIDTYLNIEAREGRITALNSSGTDERLNTVPRVVLPGIPAGVNVFLIDSGVIGTNTIVGLDSTKAMRLIRYVGADYSAIEEFVMRKSVAFRVDWAERVESAGYPEAFSVMTLD